MSGPAFDLRPATPDDVDAMVDLLSAVAEEGGWLGTEAPVDRDAKRTSFLDRLGRPATQAAVVAVAGPALAGYVVVTLAPYNVGTLGMLVDAGWRGRGVGSALVEAAVDWCRQAGAHKVDLQVWPHNLAARSLYLRHGFADEGLLRRHYRRSNGELWDAVLMGLILDRTSPGSSLGD